MVGWLLKQGYVITAHHNGEKGQTVVYRDGKLLDDKTKKELTASELVKFYMDATSYMHVAPKAEPEVEIGENYLLVQRVCATKENKKYLDKHKNKLYDAKLYDDLYLHIQNRKAFK